MGRREWSRSDDITGQCHFRLGESAVSARPLVRMHHQRGRNLEPDKLLRQLQDIPEDESRASDDIFEPNGNEDEDYEPPKAASDSSSDCNAEDTCRLEEELEDDVQQQVMPAMNVGQISEVWQRFIDNCFLCYRPGENLSAD